MNKVPKRLIGKIDTVFKKMQSYTEKDPRGNIGFIKQNEVIRILCQNHNASPEQCAQEINRQNRNHHVTARDIVARLISLKLTYVIERLELLKEADHYWRVLLDALEGNEKAFMDIMSSYSTSDSNRHRQRQRLLLFTAFQRIEELNKSRSYSIIMDFGTVFANRAFSIMMLEVSGYFGFKDKHESEQERTNNLENEVYSLDKELRDMYEAYNELQEKFDAQVKENTDREITQFFSRLNSEKYGYLIDQLSGNMSLLEDLHKKKSELPKEVTSFLALFRRLARFMQDSDVVPILNKKILWMTAHEAEKCIYKGSPFLSDDEKKRVQVVSPGWRFGKADIIISVPRVDEISSRDL